MTYILRNVAVPHRAVRRFSERLYFETMLDDSSRASGLRWNLLLMVFPRVIMDEARAATNELGVVVPTGFEPVF
jgi:hypothetical protein